MFDIRQALQIGGRNLVKLGRVRARDSIWKAIEMASVSYHHSVMLRGAPLQAVDVKKSFFMRRTAVDFAVR